MAPLAPRAESPRQVQFYIWHRTLGLRFYLIEALAENGEKLSGQRASKTPRHRRLYYNNYIILCAVERHVYTFNGSGVVDMRDGSRGAGPVLIFAVIKKMVLAGRSRAYISNLAALPVHFTRSAVDMREAPSRER